jgi:hypothetical protein
MHGPMNIKKNWTYLTRNRHQLRTVVKTVMNNQVPRNMNTFLVK